MRDVLKMGALVNGLLGPAIERELYEQRAFKRRCKRKPTDTNRDKVKAARKQRRKQKR